MMFLVSLFGCDLWWFLFDFEFFSIDWKRDCVFVCTLGPDVLQLICVRVCVGVCYGTVGIPNRRENRRAKRKSERKKQTQRNSLMREERFHIWTHWTSLPAQLQNHLKFFFSSFFVHWSVREYDNAAVPIASHFQPLDEVTQVQTCTVCVSQSPLEQLSQMCLHRGVAPDNSGEYCSIKKKKPF